MPDIKNETSSSLQLSRGNVLKLAAVALVVATAIAVCFVLPAEYRIDPTGLGKAMGLTKLAGVRPISAAQAVPAATGSAPAVPDRYYEGGYRSHTVTIPLADGAVLGGSELEYKVRMKPNAALVYSWEVEGLSDPESFYFDFHAEGGGKVGPGPTQVIEFKQGTGLKSSGVVVAPMPGIYGWYLQNQSEKPVKVHLKISGFYELIAPVNTATKPASWRMSQASRAPAVRGMNHQHESCFKCPGAQWRRARTGLCPDSAVYFLERGNTRTIGAREIHILNVRFRMFDNDFQGRSRLTPPVAVQGGAAVRANSSVL